ncbi:MAG: hypothetical protein IKS42_03870 [Oscillospiraceae bacterium]|nr:hypothetical protein [Oscillospiraceae bacterium]
MLDAAGFWDFLQAGKAEGAVREGSTPIVCLPDGTAFSFSLYENTFNGKPIYELIAADVSEEFRLTGDLEEKRKHAEYINRRLKALNASVRYLIMDRETLELKIRIHDSLGETLLMTKQAISAPQEADMQMLRRLWQTNVRLLNNEARELWQEPYFVNRFHAERLGVRVEIRGTLPEDEALIPVIDSAITVHVTNVLRHAEGDLAVIEVQEQAGQYLLRFTNNGKQPQSEICERGGLANLRRLAVGCGGTMTVRSTPDFELTLSLPKCGKENTNGVLQGSDRR